MCIIACKPVGVAFPTMDTLKNCWDSNPHGAGVAWQSGKSVRIEKGMMTWHAFEAFVEKIHKSLDPMTTAVMYHFRITSRGDTCAEQTHPYPLSRTPADMKRLTLRTRCAVMHNGTMPIRVYTGMNDTQTFVLDYLTRIDALQPDWMHNKDALELIEATTDSKMAFLKGNEIVTIGKFIEADGVLYSNDSYLPYTPYTWSKGGKWTSANGWDDDWDMSPAVLRYQATKDDTEKAEYLEQVKSKMHEQLRIINAFLSDDDSMLRPDYDLIDECLELYDATDDTELLDLYTEAELALGWGTGKKVH